MNWNLRCRWSGCLWALFALVFLSIDTSAQDQSTAKAREIAESGLQFAEAGDFARAEIALRSATQLAPGEADYWAALGSVLASERKLPEAKKCFETVLRLSPRNLQARRDLAVVQWQLNDLQPAKKNLELLLAVAPHDAEANLLLGMVLENLKDYQSAVRLLSSVPEQVRHHPEAVAALVHSYYESGQKAKARAFLSNLLAWPGDPQAVFLAAQVTTESGDYSRAEQLLSSIRTTYRDVTALEFEFALVQYHMQRFAECERTLLELVRIGNETSSIYNLLARCYEGQDRLDGAVKSFRRAIELDSQKESNYLDLTRMLVQHDALRAALEVSAQAAERFPDSYQAHDLRGTVLQRSSDFKAAVVSFTRARALNRSSAEANLALAQAQEMAGMHVEAMRTLGEGIRRFPRDARHYQESAILLLNQVESADANVRIRATQLLQKAVALDGSLAEAHYRLGNVWIDEGKLAQAQRELERAAALSSDVSKIHYSLLRLYNLLGLRDKALREQQAFEETKAAEEAASGGRGRKKSPPG